MDEKMSEQQLLPTPMKDKSITSKLLKLVPRKIEDNYEKIKARRQKLIDLMIKESGHSIDRVTAEKILDNIINYSRKFSVDPILVLAVIWKESHFNPNAKNGNFIGLMQINYSA
ncbi:MAG: transglycosylase SLT domain-containing protein, partial [Candidatus Anstonellales archaeon]